MNETRRAAIDTASDASLRTSIAEMNVIQSQVFARREVFMMLCGSAFTLGMSTLVKWLIDLGLL
ncbi:MAG: hypothetical protein MK208_10855 [Shimia sp.]|uniref:hypothetical protein n=1 Tax=Shimia sp. TaxID=1954381 RepID=UPI0025F34D2A|nr:hypothetical protein [Shimia sp.]MCH2067725.1 hypothetical protein [Shimia sp.]